MSLLDSIRAQDANREPSRATTARRRPHHARPSIEGLEERTVLSAAASQLAHVPVATQVRASAAKASQTPTVPITVTGVAVANVSRDATTGVLQFSGTLAGTILGQPFTTPVSGTVTPARNARGNPALALDLRPIQLGSSGLRVDSGAIAFGLTPRHGGGASGDLVAGGLNGVVSSAAAGSTARAASQLTALLGNGQVLDALDRALGQARTRLASFTPAGAGSRPVVDLSLAADRLSLKGLGVRLDNQANGPLDVRVTADAPGGVLGGLVAGLTARSSGAALNRAIAGVFRQIEGSPIPSAAALIAAAPATPALPVSTAAVAAPAGSTLITVDLKPLEVNLLGVEVKTSEITVTISAQPGSGELLGNLLTTVANLVNLQGVSNALNNVLANVVTLADAASPSVSGVNAGGPLGSTTSTAAVPVLTAHVAPVHLNLLGAVVDTSPIDLSIVAHPGPGNVLGNVVAGLANLLNKPPRGGDVDIPYLTGQIHNLNDQLAAAIPGIPAATSPTHTVPAGTTNVLSLNVAPINLNLLGLILQTDQIQVNADAQSGSGNLLGNLLGDLLSSSDGTPSNMAALNGEVNNLLAKVVGVLNATNLVLPTGALGTLSSTLQTLALPNLVNTSGVPDTAPVLNLAIANQAGNSPPVDVNLLGLVVTTSDVHATLLARTGAGQVLGNLVYNVSHLLDPGGSLNLLTILGQLGL